MIFEIKAFKGKKPGGGGYSFHEACGKISIRATEIGSAQWLAKLAELLASEDVGTRSRLWTAVEETHAKAFGR